MKPDKPDKPADRPRLLIRVESDDTRAGEIRLSDLSAIAGRTQQLLHRLARSVLDRSTPGRTPDAVMQQLDFTLVGIGEGSTVLEILGPSEAPELQMEAMPVQLSRRLLSTAVDGAEAASKGDALPSDFDRLASESLRDWFEAVRVFREVELAARADKVEKIVSLNPTDALEHLRAVQPPAEPAIDIGTVEGVLYLVNLRTATYAIEDDFGHTIPCHVSEQSVEVARALLGERIFAKGKLARGKDGRIGSITVESLVPVASNLEMFDVEFKRPFDFATALRAIQPVSSLEDLTIEGLSDDEQAGFSDLFAIDRGQSA